MVRLFIRCKSDELARKCRSEPAILGHESMIPRDGKSDLDVLRQKRVLNTRLLNLINWEALPNAFLKASRNLRLDSQNRRESKLTNRFHQRWLSIDRFFGRWKRHLTLSFHVSMRLR